MKAKTACGTWLDVAADCWLLGAESTLVVPLRLARLARGGGAAVDEAKLMVSEKIDAHGALLRDLAHGRHGPGAAAIAGGVVAHYLERVRANRKRLLAGGTGGKRLDKASLPAA